MAYMLVGIGGVFGAVTRFYLGRVINRRSGSAFPVGTLVINLTGAVLLGLVAGLDTGRNAYLLMGDGFLGAYTTFSTFMYEGLGLFRGSKRKNALIYIAGSLALGIAGFAAGGALGALFIH